MALNAPRNETVATVIGESIVISGNLTGDEDLTIRGRVEGSVTLNKTLILEPTGILKAEVKVKNAVISGVVVGNITASDSVELTAECRMIGDIAAPRVIIVEGASFRGRVDMGDLDMPRSDRATERPKTPARPIVATPSRPAAPPARPSLPFPSSRPAQPPAAVAKPVAPVAAKPAEKAPEKAPDKPTTAPAAPPPVPPSAMALAAKRKVLVKKK